VGHRTAVPTPVGPPRVVACVLSFRASPQSAASGAQAAANARRQAGSATLPATNSGDGSWQNSPTMDGRRGALVPLAAGFRLRGSQARGGCRYHVAGRWVKVPTEALGWRLTLEREGLSGLPHRQKPARSGFAEGWVIYPPYPMRVPVQDH
jgi:hypothetical protein